MRGMADGWLDLNERPLPPVRRRNWEFYSVSSGRVGPTFRDTPPPPLRAPSLWLMPPTLTYGWRSDGKPYYRRLFHYASVPRELEQQLEGKEYLVIPLTNEDIETLKSIVAELEPHLRNPQRYSYFVYEKVLIELTLLFFKKDSLRTNLPAKQVNEARMEHALTFFETNMIRNPTVEEVASQVHISGAHLRRLFKELRSTTPHQAFRELQIRRVREILATTTNTLEEIAPQCGFSCSTDLARVFKASTGESANVWRVNNKEL